MAIRYHIQPDNPQMRKIDAVVQQMQRGAIILFPTDTVYAIGCDLLNKEGQQRIRRIRGLPDDKPLTFIVSSLSDIAGYAQVSDPAYKLLRRLIPGPFTFLLPASKQVPKLVMNPKRKTTGIRVPANNICQSLIATLGNPVISMSAQLPGCNFPDSLGELFDMFEHLVDIIIEEDSEVRYMPDISCKSTMIDMTSDKPQIVREGMELDKALMYM
jgi:tRNA threonylcarbamoyl adenosine modification protein (Sua5/YciO/YrdC/YwlC family)